MSDMWCKLLKRITHRHAQLRGLNGVILNVLYGVQALDNRVARRFCSQVQLFHFLDELALAVARGRFRLLLRAFRTVKGNHLVFSKGRKLLVFFGAIGVNFAIPRRYYYIAFCNEGFAFYL